MKKLILSIAVIAMVATFSNRVEAQSNANSDALATLIIPISIANDVAMDFKTVSASGTAGTVVMAATSGAALTPTGGVTVISGTPTAGTFTVTGEGTQVFTITLPAGASTLTGSVAGTMTVDTWTCSEALTTAALVGGTLVFYVGGTLNVDADEVAGLYSGTFNIIVDYN
jgi:Mat/Ecp fimbriae major subunit